jgi:cell division protein FtsB
MQEQVQSGLGWMRAARHKVATAAVVVLVCLIGYGAIFGANGFLAFHHKVMDSEKLDREIQALQQDNARREEQIKALKSKPQAIEKEARERLRYARPGEVIYTLPPTPAAKPDK